MDSILGTFRLKWLNFLILYSTIFCVVWKKKNNPAAEGVQTLKWRRIPISETLTVSDVPAKDMIFMNVFAKS